MLQTSEQEAMTSLICWAGADRHGPSSAYLASDSRISWAVAQGRNHGQKVFASQRWPEIYGYCGDVTFPHAVLNQYVTMADRGLLGEGPPDPDSRLAGLFQLLETAFRSYAEQQRSTLTVLSCVRTTQGTTPAEFKVGRIDWSAESGWSRCWLPIPEGSELVVAVGSGAKGVGAWNKRWKESDAGGPRRCSASSRMMEMHSCSGFRFRSRGVGRIRSGGTSF